MNVMPKSSHVVLAAAFVSVVLSGGCSRRTPASDQISAGASGNTATDMRTASRAGNADTSPGMNSSGTSGASGTSDSSGTSGTAKEMGAKAGAAIDDSMLTAKVKTALLADSDITGLDISVTSNSGEVMLSGFVNNQTQIDRAVKIAQGIDGVKGVQNKMSLKKS